MVKGVFGTQKSIENTAGLLKAVLDLDSGEYKSLQIVDPHLRRRWKKDKMGIVDIRINTSSGKVLHIEVQVGFDPDMIPRTLFYNGRLLTEQVGAGDPYRKIRRTITIVIADHILLPDEAQDRYRNVYRFLNTVSYKAFTDLQELIIIELPKVPEQDDGTSLWPWLQYFKCKTQEELDMLAKNYPEIEPAVRRFRHFSPVRAIRDMIFEYEDARRIRAGRDAYAREQGQKELVDLLESGETLEEAKRILGIKT
jgi:predicted transposase/invertase (TIGR01784 family)